MSYSYGPVAAHQNKSRRLLFHQTNPVSAGNIMNSQHFEPNHGSYGKAVYFAKNAFDTEAKAHKKGTILSADVYLGYTKLEKMIDQDMSCDSTIIKRFKSGIEFAIRSPLRIRNINFFKGIKPYNCNWIIEMRPRMDLYYATTANKAKEIVRKRELPIEDRRNIAGKGYYLWANAEDAIANAFDIPETILGADVFFVRPYENRRSLPNNHDYKMYDSFRGSYKDSYYFMVKHPRRVEHIHYVDGKKI